MSQKLQREIIGINLKS